MKVIFFTGAGASASAGIPTYREDKNGLWVKNDLKKICYKGREFSDESINFYNDFRELCRTIHPSNVHKTIFEIQERLGKDKCKIYTQNIDILLEEAGCKEVKHIHGSINEIRCNKCNKIEIIHLNKFEKKTCECGGEFRNNIVFYGEKGNYEELVDELLLLDKNDIFICIGSSCQVFRIDLFIQPVNCLKILNNLEKIDGLNEKSFDIVIYDDAEKNILKLKNFILKILKY